MDDRELLERAAKAAGLVVTWDGDNPPYPRAKEVGGFHNPVWNPLLDDGDALRLAVKLRISVQQEADAWKMQASTNCGQYGDGAPEWAEEIHGSDPCAATRRAIVRAAASLPL
jgi:hypothetical protein